jgi:hypothetical protein
MVDDEERLERWRAILSGEDLGHRLETHGYFLTMQKRPTADADWQKILKNEFEFFQNNAIWKKLPHEFHKNVGTIELRKKLSDELCRLIKTWYISFKCN